MVTELFNEKIAETQKILGFKFPHIHADNRG